MFLFHLVRQIFPHYLYGHIKDLGKDCLLFKTQVFETQVFCSFGFSWKGDFIFSTKRHKSLRISTKLTTDGSPFQSYRTACSCYRCTRRYKIPHLYTFLCVRQDLLDSHNQGYSCFDYTACWHFDRFSHIAYRKSIPYHSHKSHKLPQIIWRQNLFKTMIVKHCSMSQLTDDIKENLTMKTTQAVLFSKN